MEVVLTMASEYRVLVTVVGHLVLAKQVCLEKKLRQWACAFPAGNWRSGPWSQAVGQRGARNLERRTKRLEGAGAEEGFADDQKRPGVGDDVERAGDGAVPLAPRAGFAVPGGWTGAAAGPRLILAVAERAIRLVFGWRDRAMRRGARESLMVQPSPTGRGEITSNHPTPARLTYQEN